MVASLLDSALEEGSLSLDDVATGTDDATLSVLRQKIPLAQKLWARQLFKKAYVRAMGLDDAIFSGVGPGGRQQLFAELSEALQKAGLRQDQFVVCLPPERKKHDGIRVLSKEGRPRNLDDSSQLVSALNRPSSRDTLIVACQAGLEQKAQKAVEAVLG